MHVCVCVCVCVCMCVCVCGREVSTFQIRRVAGWYSSSLSFVFVANNLTTTLTPHPTHSPPLTHCATLCHTVPGCNKPLPNEDRSTRCRKCQKVAAQCSLCQLPVHGLQVWCQGCGHGGHLGEIQAWFRTEEECPSGCGHRCAGSLVPSLGAAFASLDGAM